MHHLESTCGRANEPSPTQPEAEKADIDVDGRGFGLARRRAPDARREVSATNKNRQRGMYKGWGHLGGVLCLLGFGGELVRRGGDGGRGRRARGARVHVAALALGRDLVGLLGAVVGGLVVGEGRGPGRRQRGPRPRRRRRFRCPGPPASAPAWRRRPTASARPALAAAWRGVASRRRARGGPRRRRGPRARRGPGARRRRGSRAAGVAGVDIGLAREHRTARRPLWAAMNAGSAVRDAAGRRRRS